MLFLDETYKAIQLHDLAEMFSNLIQRLKEHLDSKKTDIRGIDTLVQPVDLVFSPQLTQMLCNLRKCTTATAEMFFKFSDCLDFLNIEILQSIIEELGNEQLKLDIDKLVEDVCHFLKTTTVHHLKANGEALYKPETIPQGYRTCLQQFDCLHLEPVTIDVVEGIRKATRHAFHSPFLSLVACEMASTSLVLVYLVKENEIDTFSDSIKKCFANDSSGLVEQCRMEFLLLNDYMLHPYGCIQQVNNSNINFVG